MCRGVWTWSYPGMIGTIDVDDQAHKVCEVGETPHISTWLFKWSCTCGGYLYCSSSMAMGLRVTCPWKL